MSEKEVQYLVDGVWRPCSFGKVKRSGDRRVVKDRRRGVDRRGIERRSTGCKI